MSQDFYPDLKTLSDGLFVPQLVQSFVTKHGLPLILQNAASATNQKSKTRLRDLFRRLSNTPHLGEILLFINHPDKKISKLLNTFMLSANSDMLFEYFENYSEQLVKLVEKEPQTVGLLLSLIQHQSGLKVLKTFQKLYRKHPNLEALFSEQARQQLLAGIANQDTTIAMRYIELVINIATSSQDAFIFINSSGMLEKALDHYDTTDTLLKLNVVEAIEAFGNSAWTGEYLRKSGIWQKIVEQAFNPDEEFYVRKSLIILIAKMSSIGCFEITPLAAKNFTLFLKEMLSSKIVDEVDAGLDVVSYLGRSAAGFAVISHSEQITQLYVAISRAAGQNTKTKYISSLDSIVDRKAGNKPYATVVTLLSCIGDPTLAKTHNLSGSHPIVSALPEFSKWFFSALLLPFEELKLACLELFRELLAYKEVCVELFSHKSCMDFFKRKLHRQDLILLKKTLIQEILKNGDTAWKGHELEVFASLLRTEMEKGESNEVEYQVESK